MSELATVAIVPIDPITDDLYANISLSTSGVTRVHNTTMNVDTFSGLSINKIVSRAGMRFFWPDIVSTSPEGFLLEPPRIQSASINLEVVSFTGAPRIVAYLQNRPVSLDFSATTMFGPPFPPGANTSAPLGPPYIVASVVHEITAVGAYAISLSPTTLMRVMRDNGGTAAWNGIFSLVLMDANELTGYESITSPFNHTPADSTTAFGSTDTGQAPVLSLTYTDFHTGWITDRTDRTRAVRDDRYGISAMSIDLVPDGELLGVWVHEWDQDPDLNEENRYNTRRTEIRTDNKPVR